MLGSDRQRSHVLTALVATALAAVGLIVPAAAVAAQASPLSPRLVALASPAVRSLGLRSQSRRVGLAQDGAGSLLRHGRRVVVDVRFAEGAAGATEALRGAGAQIIDVNGQYQTVTVAALPAQLPGLAAVPGVEAVQEEITPFTQATCPQGSVVSEGDRQIEAAKARNDFGVDGSGVTVGILSDSFNQWKFAPASEASDVATGDLPGPGNPCGFERPTKVISPFVPGAYPEPGEEPENPPGEGEEGEDEGRGMAQIVHDVAPGANLDFASAFNGELAFAKAIRDLQAEGAQVITDDVAYFNEPFFQDGPIADAVNEVVAKGVNYFSSAANDNLLNAEGEDIGSYEAPAYKETTCPVEVPAYYDSCMNFNPAGGAAEPELKLTVEKGAPLYADLQWAQPWGGVTTDFDMFLLNEAGEVVGNAFNTPNTEPGRQQPYEFDPWEVGIAEGKEAEAISVVIARCDIECGEERAEEEFGPGVFPYAGTKGGDEGTPRLKVVVVNNGFGVTESNYTPAKVAGTGVVVGPTIFGHTAAKSAVSVAAINVGTDEEPEEYSSRGPVLHLFGPVEGKAPAAPLGPEVIAKPNLTASDCGSTTFFFGFKAGFHFCGTSAAAPHAAGVAALVRSANPGATSDQVRAALESTARPVGTSLSLYGPDAVGTGLVDAAGAVAKLALPPTVTITGPAAVTRDTRPSIPFTANRRASIVCSFDGSTVTPCGSPFVPSAPLADGKHELVVSATDVAGRVGVARTGFVVDTTGPKATIAKHPKKVVKTRKKRVKVAFRFGASEPGATFLCAFEKGGPVPCDPQVTRRFGVGPHRLAVQAVDPLGNVGQPAVFKFRVQRVHKRGKGHGRGHRHGHSHH